VEPEDDEAQADCDGGGADVAEADPLGGRGSDPRAAATAESHSERPAADAKAEDETEADDEPAVEVAVEQPAAASESGGDDGAPLLSADPLCPPPPCSWPSAWPSADHAAAAETTLALLSPAVAASPALLSAALSAITAAGLEIALRREQWLSAAEAAALFAERAGRPDFAAFSAAVTAGPAAVMALRGVGAVDKWRALIGAAANDTDGSDPGPSSGDWRTGAHGSTSVAAAASDLQLAFSRFAALALDGSAAAALKDAAPVVITILPDSVAAGQTDEILARLVAEDDYRIIAVRPAVRLSRAQIERAHRWHPTRLQADRCERQIAALEKMAKGKGTTAAPSRSSAASEAPVV